MKKVLDYIREHIWTMLLLGVLVGLIIGSTGIYAATLAESVDVVYDNSSSSLESSDVQDALDELYGMCDNVISVSGLSLGDYVSYTPSSTSYTTDTTYTGASSTRTIDPSELTLWRVISMSTDGTVDIISEHVSSVTVFFGGLTGYLNVVGYLNLLASQYEDSTYTSGSRYFGYGGQTKYITDTSIFTETPPWTSSTGSSTVESQGGGDTMYLSDYDLVSDVLGTLVATEPSGTATSYWLASRQYIYSDSTSYRLGTWQVTSSGGKTLVQPYVYSSSTLYTNSYGACLRPIVTLKSGLTYSGSGTEADPWKPST